MRTLLWEAAAELRARPEGLAAEAAATGTFWPGERLLVGWRDKEAPARGESVSVAREGRLGRLLGPRGGGGGQARTL